MKKKPWPLVILAVIHLLTPIGNIAINSWLAKMSYFDYVRALFLPVNLIDAIIFFCVPVASAALIWVCKKWSYYTYIALMAVLFTYSFVAWTHNKSEAMGAMLILFYIINMLVVGYFMIPAVRNVYFDQRIRWWEAKPRFVTDFVGQAEIAGEKIVGNIRNISQGGLYLESENEIAENQNLDLNFKVGEKNYKIEGVVVYRRFAPPQGYGLKFHPESSGPNPIRELLTDLENSGSAVASRAPDPEDEFFYWLKSLFKTKAAWVPQSKSRRRGPSSD